MPTMKWLIVLLGMVSSLVYGDPLNGGFELGTSLSQSYQARSIFLHPAGLGFDTALNGTELATSLAMATNSSAAQDVAFAASLGYLGFGAERLTASQLSRYHFGLGLPVYGNWFLGGRVSLLRYDAGTAAESWDAGIQYRPNQRISVGFMLNQANQPLVNGARLPMSPALSLSLRPGRALELTFDASSASTEFLKKFSAQGVLNFSPVEGLKCRFGYHTEYKWFVGLQLHVGTFSLFSSFQPGVTDRRLTLGFQAGTTPYASAIAPVKTVKLNIASNLSEEAVRGGILREERPSLLDLLTSLDETSQDPSVHDVLLRVEAFPLGWASAHELHAALLRLKRAGKKVSVFLGNAGLREYLVASAADRIFLEPSGELRWIGPKAEQYFAKGTLDKLGVEAEFLAAGKYKSAPEMFLRKGSSEVSKAALREELEILETNLKELLSRARGIDAKRWKVGAELGLLSSQEALKERFIDGIDSYSAALAKYERAGLVLPVSSRRRELLALPVRVGVVVASGSILPRKFPALALGGSAQVTPAAVERKLQAARSDSNTKALVLRISSPGGEVLASQQIATLLEDFKSRLPIVVSMGDIAASGGYYIAAPGNKIFAGPLTLTGSIGVFLGKFQFEGLYRFIDLHKEVTTSSPYPRLFSEDQSWSASERAVMARRLQSYYDGFVGFVAKSRSLTPTLAAAAAQGRVWTGEQAFENGLVDKMGGYYETLQYVAEQLGVAPYEMQAYEVSNSEGLFESLASGPWGSAAGMAGFVGGFFPSSAWENAQLIQALRDSPFLYMAPYKMVE